MNSQKQTEWQTWSVCGHVYGKKLGVKLDMNRWCSVSQCFTVCDVSLTHLQAAVITAAVYSCILCCVSLVSQPGYRRCVCVCVCVCGGWGCVVLDLLNLAEADSSPHTCVQMHKCARMLNQPTSNDFHVVTFLTNTNTHLHTNVHTHTHTHTHTQTDQLPTLNLSQFPEFIVWTVESSLLAVSGIWKGKVNSSPPS